MIVTNETKALAQEVVDFIMANPERHNQQSWFGSAHCGTTMCIAGTVAMFELDVNSIKDFRLATQNESILDFAGERLGLSHAEAHSLFFTRDNRVAFDAVNAIAQGDMDKFYHILGI